ncbi:hypothetical protein FIBSPDRAFT_461875 [Athelia psychrophila]|uniref:Uncharacterized protein n=1 Tax=Athelia psychrophila TaxID=1759441 RepID=A0A166LWG6_9AGAM|nr:hypothetical protein FIBSPDRAFT_461875 [Fibularhizoctonia sp. CBS 109695]
MASGARRAFSPNNEDDEDEGWASDSSAPRGASAADDRTRSKSPKVKIVSKPVGAVPRKGRRRNSMRKGLFGRTQLNKQKQPEDDAVFEDAVESDEERRGRSMVDEDASSSRAGSLRSRLDNLRRLDTHRDESPARSVRFADGGSGANTPRLDGESMSGTATPMISILQDTSSPSSATAHHHTSASEDSKNKVTFNLP